MLHKTSLAVLILASGLALAQAPATSTDATVEVEQLNAPKLIRTSKPGDTQVRLQPGANNPVGVYWLSLSRKHWGIHGTSEPSQMARVSTGGCIRLTHRDVQHLASMVKPGTPVDVQS